MNWDNKLEITKCSGDNCPLKNSCGRSSSIEISDYQGMFVKPPFKLVKGKFSCDMFWGDRAEYLLQELKSILKK